VANFLIVGRRQIPRSSVALVEPCSFPDDSISRPTAHVYGRVVLINRDSILVGEYPVSFSRVHGFCWLSTDQAGLNPDVSFRVQDFLPPVGFVPSRAFASRVVWRDQDGNEQSKLLLSEPNTVLEALSRAKLG
jgi:hypothetical protein